MSEEVKICPHLFQLRPVKNEEGEIIHYLCFACGKVFGRRYQLDLETLAHAQAVEEYWRETAIAARKVYKGLKEQNRALARKTRWGNFYTVLFSLLFFLCGADIVLASLSSSSALMRWAAAVGLGLLFGALSFYVFKVNR